MLPFISRILAPLIVAFLAWAAQKTGIVALTDQHFQDTIIAAIVWLITEVTHIVISKKTNPGNAASSQLAEVDKARNEAVKNETSSSA
jgi:hypothetical protein